jgi:hypothetical protein
MEMASTTVHKVRLYDAKNDETIISRRYATPEGAETMGGEIIEGTEVVIDLTELEPGFNWTPRDFVPAPGSAKRG